MLFSLSDIEIVIEIGRRLQKKRLNKNISQQKLATLSGVSRTTISDIENGKTYNILTLIQLLRGLESLDDIDNFIVDPGISPIELSKLKGKKKQRSSKKRKKSIPLNNNNSDDDNEDNTEW